jgi:hypothetical protein
MHSYRGGKGDEMTNEQLDAIRARLDAASPDILNKNRLCFGDCCRTKAEKEVIANAPTDLRALLDEVERLTAERHDLLRWRDDWETFKACVAAGTDSAFARGAAAMRTAVVEVARKRADLPKHSDLDSAWCRSAECILDELRNLPLPEDK